MEIDDIVACLHRIETRLSSDEYESGGIYTIGGPVGQYLLRSPFNSECEWTPYGIYTTPNPATIPREAERQVINLPSAARASYTSGPITVGDLTELTLDVNVSALTGGTAPTVAFNVSRVEPDTNLYAIYNPAAISAAGTFNTSIGSGLATNAGFGDNIQVDMVTTGAPTSITFSLSLKGKGPVTPSPGNGTVAISASDPTIVPNNPTIGSAGSGLDNNAFPGMIVPVSYAQSLEFTEMWQPLGRGLNLYVTISTFGGLVYAACAFRRKLDRAIPVPPRRRAHTHSLPQSRRISRNIAQAGHERYGQGFDEPLLSDDPAAIGNVEEMTPAQKVLAKLRNGGR